MSVYISKFYPNGGADYVHLPDGDDPTVHQGHWTPAQVQANTSFVNVQQPDGSQQPWLARIAVRCSDCGAVSTHPVSGGAVPQRAQRLFTTMLKGRQAGRTWPQAVAIAKSLAKAEGGGWALPDDAKEEDDGTDGPGTLHRLSTGDGAS